MTHHLSDVVLHDGGQGRLVPDLRDPAGQLGVPHGGVAADELAIVLCELGSLVGATKVELATGRLSGIPLHAILKLVSHSRGVCAFGIHTSSQV